MKRRRPIFTLSLVVLLGMMVVGSSAPALAAEREILLTTNYTSLVVAPEEDISIRVTVTNNGKVGERVNLEIVSAPEGWKAAFKDRGYNIRGLSVPAEEEQTIFFEAEAPKEAAGEYKFLLRATTEDGQLQSSAELTIWVEEKAAKEGGLELSAEFPVLGGPSGRTFEFSVDLNNKTEEDLSFNLSAKAPDDWEVSFKPAFTEKEIRTISLKSRDTRGVDIGVTSPERAEPGEYTIDMQAAAGDVRGTIQLKVVITGTFELGMTTSTGRLNTEATAGRASNITMVAQNLGTAPVPGISFTSFPPEGWTVTFNPDRLESLAPGETRDILVTIEPSDKTIAGDYSINLRGSGFMTSDSLELRVSVATPTIWGWVGVFIVVLVVAGLAVVFVRVGRR
ncbi:MAG: NEW3 domain-containing protein [Dehalococcoidia bacterium]